MNEPTAPLPLPAPLPSYNITAPVKRHIAVGVFEGIYATGSATVDAREAAYGFKFENMLRFQDVQQLDFAQLKAIKDKGRNPILNMEVRHSFLSCTSGYSRSCINS
jgi:hypothetical protein